MARRGRRDWTFIFFFILAPFFDSAIFLHVEFNYGFVFTILFLHVEFYHGFVFTILGYVF